MKILLVACLVAVCSATPPVPNIPQTFCGSGESIVITTLNLANVRELDL